MKYNLVIIDSGSVGAAAGYCATRAGLKVLMVDAHMPPHQQGSHHDDTRLVRHAYDEGGKYVPLMLRAQTLWGELSTHNEEPIFVHSEIISLDPAGSTFLATAAQDAKQWQLNVEQLGTAVVMARWPEIHIPDNYIGLFKAESGLLRSELVIRTWIRLAEETGCAQLFRRPVSAVHHDGDGITVGTAGGDYRAKKAVISASTWVQALAPELPIQSVRKVFAWYQADGHYSVKNNFPAFTGRLPNSDQYYGSPAENDELRIGKRNGGQVIRSTEKRKPFAAVASDGSKVFLFLRTILPGVDCCLHGASCTYDSSLDEDFIADTLPEHDNTLIITGLGGRSSKFASVLGEIAVDFTQDKPSGFNLTPFRLSRFK